MLLNSFLVLLALILAALLLRPKIRENLYWRAMVTPLASIIGSGFLVIVPLLGNAVGSYAPLAIITIVSVAYLIGGTIRFNIQHAEKHDDLPDNRLWLLRTEYTSDIALAVAYFISVTFYLRLLSSFVLNGVENEVFYSQLLTSAVLIFIGCIGWFKGLDLLEKLEEYSVSIKLAIIGSLIIGWGIYDLGNTEMATIKQLIPKDLDLWHSARLLAGILIVVQGFETSRYLGEHYSSKLRIKTMRAAQLSSGLIYVIFVTLSVPTFIFLSPDVSETAIITLSKNVATVLPSMLILAAVMSQFSAAVADTVGSGGLIGQTLGKRFGFGARFGYLAVVVIGLVLTWTANIFLIISFASQAFAIYYALQALVAAFAAYSVFEGQKKITYSLGFAFFSAFLFFLAAIAIPAG